MGDADTFLVVSEFAAVRVELDVAANGPRLRLSDEKSGRFRYLDPLVLEGLVWAADEDLIELVDPSKRWVLETPGDDVDSDPGASRPSH